MHLATVRCLPEHAQWYRKHGRASAEVTLTNAQDKTFKTHTNARRLSALSSNALLELEVTTSKAKSKEKNSTSTTVKLQLEFQAMFIS